MYIPVQIFMFQTICHRPFSNAWRKRKIAIVSAVKYSTFLLRV